MIIKHFAAYRVMAISLGIILILAFWPIAKEFRYYRPDWLSLWLVFWALYYPQKMGVWLAFLVGLLWDLAASSLLGSYALSSATVVYAARRLGRNVVLFNIVEKAVLVIFLVVLALVVRLALWLMVDHMAWSQVIHYLSVLLVTILAWPLVLDALAQDQRQK
jgi:rod shape-determining protein MreD